MKLNPRSLLSPALVVLSFALAAALYTRLPESVPVHWDVHGRANGFMAKPLGAFILPMVTLGSYLLLTVLPRISPRGYDIDRFARVFELLKAAITAFLFLITALALLAAAGAPVPIARAVPAAVGLLLAVLGNFMGKVTRNFFVGIRTPWTLASDEVWLRTHRLGGKMLVLGGAALLLSALAGGGFLLAGVAAVIVAAAVPIVYSYLLYRRLESHS
jgi:uncharacterized membrane protein